MIKNLCSGIVFLRFEFWLTSYFLGDLFLLFDLQFPGGSDGKESACNAEDLGWENPLEKGMATTSVCLPEEFCGQRSLVGYSPQDCKESDTTAVTEHACPHTSIRRVSWPSLVAQW